MTPPRSHRLVAPDRLVSPYHKRRVDVDAELKYTVSLLYNPYDRSTWFVEVYRQGESTPLLSYTGDSDTMHDLYNTIVTDPLPYLTHAVL